MINWRYCLDELPEKDEVIMRMIRRNRADREDKPDQWDSYPCFVLEYAKPIYSSHEQFKHDHAQMTAEGIDFDYWWVYAKELNWPDEILKMHTFTKKEPYEWEKK